MLRKSIAIYFSILFIQDVHQLQMDLQFYQANQLKKKKSKSSNPLSEDRMKIILLQNQIISVAPSDCTLTKKKALTRELDTMV